MWRIELNGQLSVSNPKLESSTSHIELRRSLNLHAKPWVVIYNSDAILKKMLWLLELSMNALVLNTDLLAYLSPVRMDRHNSEEEQNGLS